MLFSLRIDTVFDKFHLVNFKEQNATKTLIRQKILIYWRKMEGLLNSSSILFFPKQKQWIQKTIVAPGSPSNIPYSNFH